MAFNYEEEEEEVLTFNGFPDDDEDDDEEYEDVTEFGRYDEEELATRWGSLDFEGLLLEFESILASSRKFFFSKRKRIIDGEEMMNLATLIQDKLPNEIVEAKNVINNRNNIVAGAKQNADAIIKAANEYSAKTNEDANTRANQIIASAQKQAEEMVATHNITQQARIAAEQIIAEARAKADEIVTGTNAGCEEYIAKVMEWASAGMSGSNEYVQGVLNASKKVFRDSITGIDQVLQNYGADYERRISDLKRGPNVKLK
ncbi:MAG: hypothetical protein NC122_07885 [Faecalibacterium sp.]|nr:hypothetical protein [Ruminococcus sp.]MCM1391172.1 hypothetical protein [Ruminococcus sp.]MCM1486114.1 hypothetical protein [Faecalibacterium sp.]